MSKDLKDDKYIQNFLEFADNYQKALKQLVEFSNENQPPAASGKLSDILSDMMANALKHPEELYKKQLELATDYAKIWGNVLGRYLGNESAPLYPSDPKDRRFKDPSWQENLAFDFIKQSYILTSQWMADVAESLEDKDKRSAQTVRFYTRQLIDAMSPSNFAFTNPQVIKETLDTKGKNLVRGMQHLVEDLENSKKFFQIKTTDMNHFKLGENIATCKGSVIYRNDLMELIQYAPRQKHTYQTPLLIIPAWINKYYIFDLSEDNSFVRWLLDKGHTVFIISWINPDNTLVNKKFEDYMLQGPIAALDAIEKATGEKEVNAMGYCLGGTLLTCTLAYLATKKQAKRVKSATCLTTLVDFAEAGDMSLFIDEEQLKQLDESMKKTGYLDGKEMAAIFSALRANDLIWTFVVNNYLLGREPFPFDILYWNSDTTRLPATTHSFYLSNMYLKNALVKPGTMVLGGVPIDITAIKTPCYLFATQEDHIAPWASCYKTTQLIPDSTFVLGASGHVSGVINPPAKNKYGYWVGNNTQPKTASLWLKKAKKNDGSWWEHWDAWARSFAGKKVPALQPGSGTLKPLENAPGTYVRIKN